MKTTKNTPTTPTTPAERLADLSERFETLRKAFHAFEGMGVSALAWHEIPNNEFLTISYRGMMIKLDAIADDLAALATPADPAE